MSISASDIRVTEYYQLYVERRERIDALLSQIVNDMHEEGISLSAARQYEIIRLLNFKYPFVRLLYVLDERGLQVSDNITVESSASSKYERGKDRSGRPYYDPAGRPGDVVVTPPYISLVDESFCVSAGLTCIDAKEGRRQTLVLDADLTSLLDYLAEPAKEGHGNRPEIRGQNT